MGKYLRIHQWLLWGLLSPWENISALVRGINIYFLLYFLLCLVSGAIGILFFNWVLFAIVGLIKFLDTNPQSSILIAPILQVPSWYVRHWTCISWWREQYHTCLRGKISDTTPTISWWLIQWTDEGNTGCLGINIYQRDLTAW